MKSLIQWEYRLDRVTGTIKNCPTFVNLYRDEKFHSGSWYFTIRRYGRNIVVCDKEYQTREAAMIDAAKFFVISILTDIHPKLARLKNEYCSFHRFEPVQLFLNGQPISFVNSFADDPKWMDIEPINTLGILECLQQEDGIEPTFNHDGNTIELTRTLTADSIVTAGEDSGLGEDGR